MYDLNYFMTGQRSLDPHVFNIETTNACNQTCPMCPRSLMKRKVQHMTDADFELILGQIRPHTPIELGRFNSMVKDKYGIGEDEQSEDAFYYFVSFRCLTLHGYGEPLLDPKIMQRVQACTDRGIPTYFSCKPVNVNKQMLDELDKAGLTILKLAWDYMPTNFNWAKMITGWKGRMKIVVSMVAKDNCDYPGFVEFWREKGIYAYIKSQDNRWFYNEGAPENKSHYMKSYCQFPWISMTVLSNGDVVPCTQDYDGEMQMGNIREQSLKDIWNSDAYNRMRSAHTSGAGLDNYKCKDRCDIPTIGEQSD